jgi:hypothetical protein
MGRGYQGTGEARGGERKQAKGKEAGARRKQERGEKGRGGGARRGKARRGDIGRRNNIYARTRTLAYTHPCTHNTHILIHILHTPCVCVSDKGSWESL